MTSAQPAAGPTVRKDEVNVRRMAKVVAALVAAMAVGAAVCWVFPADPPMADRTVFPPQMAELRPWRQVVVHHTASPGGVFDSEAGELVVEGVRAAGPMVHFVVGNGRGMADGEVRATRLWIEQQPTAGCPASGVTGRKEGNEGEGPFELTVAVALVGDFRMQPPTAAQMDTVVELVRELTGRLRIPLTGVLAHSEAADADCPGSEFPLADFLRRLGERPR